MAIVFDILVLIFGSPLNETMHTIYYACACYITFSTFYFLFYITEKIMGGKTENAKNNEMMKL